MATPSTSGFDLGDAMESIRTAIADRLSGQRVDDERPGARDIRAAILTELSTEPMHGYQLIRAIEARSGGEWTPGAGAVYPMVQLLADESLVSATQVGERKVYALTDAGRQAAALLESSAGDAQARQGRQGRTPDGALPVAAAGARLAHAVTQVGHSADAEQRRRAVAILDEARRSIYALLAEK